MLFRPSRLVAAAGATAALACCACGKPAAVAVSGTTLSLTLSDFAIAPQDVDLPAGRVTLEVRNAGSVAHRLQVRAGTRVLATGRPLPPGQRTTVVVTLAPGTYVTTDPLDRNDTLGQRGEIRAR